MSKNNSNLALLPPIEHLAPSFKHGLSQFGINDPAELQIPCTSYTCPGDFRKCPSKKKFKHRRQQKHKCQYIPTIKKLWFDHFDSLGWIQISDCGPDMLIADILIDTILRRDFIKNLINNSDENGIVAALAPEFKQVQTITGTVEVLNNRQLLMLFEHLERHENKIISLLKELGLTPASREKLKLVVAAGENLVADLAAKKRKGIK